MKFLIIRLSSLGDIIHTLPVLHKLRTSYPEAQIDWLTGEKGIEILSIIKEINNLHIISPDVIKKLQKENYDYVIDIQGLFKTALAGKLCMGKKLIGFKNTREFADIFYDEKIDVGNLFKTKNNIVDLNLKLIEGVSKNSQKNIKFLIPEIKTSNISISKDKKIVLVFPATTWQSKHWNMDYWYEVISYLEKTFTVHILASKIDEDRLKTLFNKLDLNKINYNNLVGKTKIKDLIYLIQNSNLVIGLDSAGLHLASAVKNDSGMPQVIGIYGPTSVYRNGPFNQLENCVYIKDLDCMPCRKKNCPLKHNDCMEKLLPKYVIEKINV